MVTFCSRAGGFILRGDIEDAVGIDIKGYFDLRDAARSGGNAFKAEPSEGHVIRRHGAFTLQHVDIHGGLVVIRGRERSAILRMGMVVLRSMIGVITRPSFPHPVKAESRRAGGYLSPRRRAHRPGWQHRWQPPHPG